MQEQRIIDEMEERGLSPGRRFPSETRAVRKMVRRLCKKIEVNFKTKRNEIYGLKILCKLGCPKNTVDSENWLIGFPKKDMK
jgi:hypothetical protein